MIHSLSGGTAKEYNVYLYYTDENNRKISIPRCYSSYIDIDIIPR